MASPAPDRLELLMESLESLDRRVSDLEDPAARSPGADRVPVDDGPGSLPAPVRWERLSGDQAQSMWEKVWEFACWLTLRYELDASVLPTCWSDHGFAVEEITALWTARESAFHPEAGADQPLWWNEALARSVMRLKERLQPCSTGCVLGYGDHQRPGWLPKRDDPSPPGSDGSNGGQPATVGGKV